MKKIQLVAILFIMSVSLYGQAPDFMWAKSGTGNAEDNSGRSVVTDASGNSYFVGCYTTVRMYIGSGPTLLTNVGEADILIAKYDAAGLTVWIKNFGGVGDDKATDVAVDASGNLYVTGYYTSPTINFGSTTLYSTGEKNIFIVKCNSSGSPVWAISAGGSQDDEGNGIALDPSGNIYVTGYYDSPEIVFGTDTLINADSIGNAFVVKCNSSGTALWAKSAEGTGIEEAKDIAVDGAGNAYVTGHFYSDSLSFDSVTTVSNSGLADIFIAKYDPNGNVIWAKSSGGALSDYGTGISVKANGYSTVTGNFGSTSITFSTFNLVNANTGTNDLFILKQDPVGNDLWAYRAGGIQDDNSNGVAVDTAGNSYITGGYASATITFGATTLTNTVAGTENIFIVKYSSSGTVIWARSYGGTLSEKGNAVGVNITGYPVITGTFSSSGINFGVGFISNQGGPDLFVARLDPGGVNIFARSSSSESTAKGESIAVDRYGNSYVTGYFINRTITFGGVTLTNKGWGDVFVVKYDSLGNVLWAKSAGTVGQDAGVGICVDTMGNAYITGIFDGGSIVFGSFTLFNSGNADLFFVKYDSAGNVVWARREGGSSLDLAEAITIDSASNIIITGFFQSSSIFPTPHTVGVSSGSTAFFVKLDSDGNILWARSPTSGGSTYGNAISTDLTGNCYFTGNYGSSSLTSFGSGISLSGSGTFTVKYNPSGTPLWARNGSGAPNAIATDPSGNSYVSNGGLLKYDASGTLLWTKSYPGLSISSLRASDDGSLYVSGSYGAATFTLDGLTLTNTNSSSSPTSEIFIGKFNSAGTAIWIKSAGGLLNDLSYSIDYNQNSEVFITGSSYSRSCSYDTISHSYSGNLTMFACKLKEYELITAQNNIADISNGFTVFPNPSAGVFTLKFSEHGTTKNEVSVYSSIGNKVYFSRENAGAKEALIDVSYLSKGIYFVEIKNTSGQSVQKIIIN